MMNNGIFSAKSLKYRLIKSIMLSGIMVVIGSIAYSQPFYVDPVNGLDTYNGSFTTPFQTLTKAQTAVRNYMLTQSTGLNADLYVYLKGGNYPLSATLNFSSLDGGSNGFNVIYKAYNNEKPIVNGGKKVTGWTKVTGQEYYVANVPTTGAITYPSYCRQIWVNGRRCRQAKSDFINVYPKSFDDVSTTQVADGYIVKKAAIKAYTNLSDIRIFILKSY